MDEDTRLRENHERGAALFIGIRAEDIAQILATAVVKRFAQGETVARENDRQTHLSLIKAGSVKVTKMTSSGRKVPIAQLLPGEAYGIGALLPTHEIYPLGGEAINETEVYTWGRAKARQFAKKFPALLHNAIVITVERVRLFTDRLLAVVEAENRLTQELLHLGVQMGQQTPRGLEVRATGKSLAALAHTDLSTANQILGKWQDNGAVKKNHGKLLIRSPETMIRMVAGPRVTP